MKKFLMMAPDNYIVEYEINPWMLNNIGSVDKSAALSQWMQVREAILHAGGEVVVMSPAPEYCPDAVFISNAGLIYQDIFISSRLKHEERAVEEHYFIEWFKNHNFKSYKHRCRSSRADVSFEGSGDALYDANINSIWYGIGQRSTMPFKAALDKFFESESIMIRPVKLINEDLAHLDMCMCPLETGDMLWYPGGFSTQSQLVIESWNHDHLIEVSREDAYRFACNSISVGTTIIMPEVSEKLIDRLNSKGYDVIICDMSEFIKAGGACKSVVIEINE